MATGGRFSIGDVALRFVAAFALVVATWNPTGMSFGHWVMATERADALGPLHAFVGVLLLTGWVIFLAATFRSLGILGLALTTALFASLAWVLVDTGILPHDSRGALTWIVLVCSAGVLSVGMSWSHIWRRLSGQIDVDDGDSS